MHLSDSEAESELPEVVDERVLDDAPESSAQGASTHEEDSAAEESSLALLTRAWVNEKFAPCLLRYEEDAVRDLKEFLSEQESILEQEEDASESASFVANLYQQSIERARFVLRAYLRERLTKLSRFAFHYGSAEEPSDFITEAELKFVRRYKDAVERHFHNSFLGSIDERLRSTAEQSSDVDMVPAPPMGNYRMGFIYQKPYDRNNEGNDGQIAKGYAVAAPFDELESFLLSNGGRMH